MHWELSDEQEMFSVALREWISKKFPVDTVAGLLDEGDATTFTSALLAEGWWGVGFPESDGGQGGGPLELALAAREFGRAAAPNAAWMAAALVAPALGGPELADLLTGGSRYALAVRSDRVPGSADVVVADGRITGSVAHVLAAAGADGFVVPVRLPDGIELVRVGAENAVIRSKPLLDRSRSAATVTFDGAPVEVLECDAGRVLDEISSLAAVLLAADSLGSAERMLELTVEYSKQRKQFGQVIGAFQAVKHAAAQMLVTVEAAYSIALYAAAVLEEDPAQAPIVTAVAKAQVSGPVADLADTALTVHGAIGYTWEHELHLHYKRAKLNRVLFGSPSAWNEKIATALLPSAV
jgi:alkylation response protein AidB-like acyl-CoA dehydrogenase